MKKILGLALLFTSAAVSAESFSQDNLSVGAHAGLMGYGLNAQYQFTEKVSARAEFNTYSASKSAEESGIDYKFKAKLNSFGLLANYSPFESGFRLTGGVYHNGNKITGSGKYVGTDVLNIGGTDYSGADIANVKAKVDFNTIAPYIGVGYVAKIGQANLGFDLGVLYQGSPEVNIDVTPGAAINANQAAKDLLLSNAKKEEKDLQDDLDDFKVLPVAKITISYSF